MKVLTAQEMARVEKRAVERGCSEEKFMEEAGRKVALAAMEFVEKKGLPKRIAILIGKGNNGGDGYAAALCLLDEKYQVRAISLYEPDECSALNQKFRDKFLKKRGKASNEVRFEEGELILDGLLGTGFRGALEPKMGKAIERANSSGNPILAIDIPSGLDGTTGEARGAAIQAVETIALGFPKIGFFLRDGWNHVGKIRIEDFGLSKEDACEAEAIAELPDRLELPKIVRNRHKYQAGYVVGFGGSEEMSGAVKLSGLAALRGGAGIVRIFHLEEIGPAPFELICCSWNETKWKEAIKKARALFIGPGLGTSKQAIKWLQTHLQKIDLPCVLDADALLPNLKKFPKSAILTPHRGEVLRLLGLKKAPAEEELLAKVIRFSERNGVTVVLKGAPTFIFSPKMTPVVLARGDPGMATAGAGDVLTGIIAALLAQGLPCHNAAVVGATLHAIAGEEAAKQKTSYSLIASDLIEALPLACKVLLCDEKRAEEVRSE